LQFIYIAGICKYTIINAGTSYIFELHIVAALLCKDVDEDSNEVYSNSKQKLGLYTLLISMVYCIVPSDRQIFGPSLRFLVFITAKLSKYSSLHYEFIQNTVPGITKVKTQRSSEN
jgi:hypothetical protein